MRRVTVLLMSVLALPTLAVAATPTPSAWTDFFRVSPNGAGLIAIAPESDGVGRLAGSPSGNAVAFTTNAGLWVTSGTRRSARLLSPSGAGVRELTWSGNGRRIAFAACDGPPPCDARISIVDVGTGSKTTLPFFGESLSLSGDGNRIVVRPQASNSAVLATATGRVIRRLVGVADARFAPRGRLLAYTDAVHRLCLMREDGRQKRCSRSTGFHPVWSGDGSTIAFQKMVSDGAFWRFALMSTRTLVARPVGPEGTWPDADGWNAFSLSHDGRMIAAGGQCVEIVTIRGKRCLTAQAGPCSASETGFLRSGQVAFSSVCVGYRSLSSVTPDQAVAQAKQEWLRAINASAASGDRARSFPSPPRRVLLKRLRVAEARFGFDVASVTMLHPLQDAPVVVIRSNRKLPIARATPHILDLIDPHHKTKQNPSGFAYEGIFFVAQTTRGVPYLAVFNHWRAPHVGGGQWAASESLYPYPHG
jgi:hypothetical protein